MGSSYRFKKHPQYLGKNLTIQRGRADVHVKDEEILEGREWARFVSQGLLVQIPDEKPFELASVVSQPDRFHLLPVEEEAVSQPIKDENESEGESEGEGESESESEVRDVHSESSDGSVSRSPMTLVSGGKKQRLKRGKRTDR